MVDQSQAGGKRNYLTCLMCADPLGGSPLATAAIDFAVLPHGFAYFVSSVLRALQRIEWSLLTVIDESIKYQNHHSLVIYWSILVPVLMQPNAKVIVTRSVSVGFMFTEFLPARNAEVLQKAEPQ